MLFPLRIKKKENDSKLEICEIVAVLDPSLLQIFHLGPFYTTMKLVIVSEIIFQGITEFGHKKIKKFINSEVIVSAFCGGGNITLTISEVKPSLTLSKTHLMKCVQKVALKILENFS